jgi:hypothetical protein
LSYMHNSLWQEAAYCALSIYQNSICCSITHKHERTHTHTHTHSLSVFVPCFVFFFFLPVSDDRKCTCRRLPLLFLFYFFFSSSFSSSFFLSSDGYNHEHDQQQWIVSESEQGMIKRTIETRKCCHHNMFPCPIDSSSFIIMTIVFTLYTKFDLMWPCCDGIHCNSIAVLLKSSG